MITDKTVGNLLLLLLTTVSSSMVFGQKPIPLTQLDTIKLPKGLPIKQYQNGSPLG